MFKQIAIVIVLTVSCAFASLTCQNWGVVCNDPTYHAVPDYEVVRGKTGPVGPKGQKGEPGTVLAVGRKSSELFVGHEVRTEALEAKVANLEAKVSMQASLISEIYSKY